MIFVENKNDKYAPSAPVDRQKMPFEIEFIYLFMHMHK